MPAQKAIDADMGRAIVEYTLDGYSPGQIRGALLNDPRFAKRTPVLRTIQRFVRGRFPPDPLGDWTLADSDPDEARYVLDCLAYVTERSSGKVTIGRSQVQWIVRVAKAAPGLSAKGVYGLAQAYTVYSPAYARGLDLYLAFKPWESDAAAKRWRESVAPQVGLGVELTIGLADEALIEFHIGRPNVTQEEVRAWREADDGTR